MPKPLYLDIADRVAQLINMNKSTAVEWGAIGDKSAELEKLIRDHMPGGSGFDNGTTLDDDATRADKLVFRTAFHHMDESGGYDGWTEHTVIITPAFGGFDIRVTGRNRNDIKAYIADTFQHALSAPAGWATAG